MGKISVYGYEGTNEELEWELALGMSVQRVWDMPNGKGVYVEFEEKRKGGRPSQFDKGQIKRMRADGNSYGEIATAVGCSKSYVIKVCKE